MSLATRCSHCGTIFKVVQDQLKVSEGWVRCGRCNEVFNALPALFDLTSEAPPPRQVPQQAAPQPPQPSLPPSPPPVSQTFQRPTPPERSAASAAPHAGPHAASQATSQAAPPASRPPVWHRTQPAGLEQASAAAHAPRSAPPAPAPVSPFGAPARPAGRPAAPDFELDTSVDLPSTDEADALESRYLLPSDARPVVRRRGRGPEFADAQFPQDLDAEDEWARYQDSVPAPLTQPPPMGEAAHQPLAGAVIGEQHGEPERAERQAPDVGDAAERANLDAEASPPPRPEDGYVPEQPVRPPSQRKGQSGARGREPAKPAPEFVRRAQRRAFWRLPVVRAVMGLLALLLALALTVQLGHHFRDWIAAHQPASRPLLEAWCAQVGCQIKAPMQLDALQVDSATLVRTASEGPGRYRLTVAVSNRQAVDLAWPHIDLSLTDDRGSVIARRAFSARDAQVAKGEGLPLLSVPEAAPAGQSTPLQWSIRLDDLAPAGYTAELFYP